jgi:hypothetical protein
MIHKILFTEQKARIWDGTCLCSILFVCRDQILRSTEFRAMLHRIIDGLLGAKLQLLRERWRCVTTYQGKRSKHRK